MYVPEKMKQRLNIDKPARERSAALMVARLDTVQHGKWGNMCNENIDVRRYLLPFADQLILWQFEGVAKKLLRPWRPIDPYAVDFNKRISQISDSGGAEPRLGVPGMFG